jgi:Legionella pneumophila major outer membrane protein precursor
MANAKARPLGTLAVAASAAALPLGGGAQAVDYPVKAKPVAPVWVPQWTFSAEGGLLISNYSRSAFPGGIAPAFTDKLGSLDTEICDIFTSGCATDRSGSLSPRRNRGWYGALSIGRDIDPIWDWRLSGSFNSFRPNGRSASVTQLAEEEESTTGPLLSVTGPFALFSSSRLVTETDRFRYATVDFDLGRKWESGLLHLRSFGGLRALGTDDRFDITDAESKGLTLSSSPFFFESQNNRFTETHGRSNFFGAGPRIGLEGFYGTMVGITGSASAAAIAGWRHSTFSQISTQNFAFTFCEGSCIGPIPLINSVKAVNVSHSGFEVVGDLAASLGLALRPTPTASLEAGYRVEALLNVRDSFGFANPISGQFDNKRDVLIHGPYVKGVIRY